MSKGTIKKVAGPLVIAEGMRDANMYDVVRVSEQRLIGEIIEMHGDQASIQVYEETAGLGPGEPVESTEMPLSVELGPGLITSIYDGIQRPLDDIMKLCGNNLKRGVEVPSLKRDKKWTFVPTAKAGDEVEAGDIIGTVQETAVVEQRIMIPYGIEGTIKEIKGGDFTVDETVAVVTTKDGDKEVSLMQKWPVRKGRPYKKKLPPTMPLVTGQPVDCREVTFVSQCGIQSPEYLNDTQGCLRYRLRNISTWRGYCSDYGQCAFSSVFSKVYHMSGSLIELCQTGS